MFLFALYALFVLVVIGIGVFLYILNGMLEKKEVSRSFEMDLFLVAFPRDVKDRELGAEQVREKIALMENFFSSVRIIKDSSWRAFLYGASTLSLELAVSHVGEEIHFYVAVPRKFSASMEKMMQGTFPVAYVERVKDYNIFNPEGAAAACRIVLKKTPLMPVKTYRELPGDPLKEITNSFSKLSREGEGAVFQLNIKPVGRELAMRIVSHVGDGYKGKRSFKDVGRGLDVTREFGEIFSALFSSKNDKKDEMTHRATPKEEEYLKRMEAKASKDLFQVSMRLITSAATTERAEQILDSLEAAFSQFEDPELNSFGFERVTNPSALKKFIYRFSFRVFSEAGSMIMNSEELSSLYHFPNVLLDTPKIKFVKAKEAPPPPDAPREGLLLGYNAYRGTETAIRLPSEDRRRHFYIIGQTGTGKSVFLKNMIRQDIEDGKGLCFIDPHGQEIEEVMGYVPEHRVKDVVYFDPADISRPMGLNMLEYDTRFPEQKTMVVNELFGIFQKLYGGVPESLGPMFEQYFRNATLLVMEDPSTGNTMLEISRVMADKDFRDLKLSHCGNIVVRSFWETIAEKAGGEASLANMVPYITSKFDNFLANEIMRPIIAQEKSAFNFRDIMDNKKILLINLSKGRLGELNSSLLGLIIVGKLLIAALSRTDIPEEIRNDFYVYLDEFQNVTTPSIATILSEARKYRLNLTMAHQFIGQLEENIKKAVFGNVGSMAAFRVGSEDAEFLEKQLAPVFMASDLVNVDNFSCYVKLLIKGKTATPFSVRTYPPNPFNREYIEKMKEYSRLTFGRPRDEIEHEIMQSFARM